jgi:hypothetical protein
VTGGYTSKDYNEVESIIDSYHVVTMTVRVPNEAGGETPFEMLTARAGHAAVNMHDNVVLLFGGFKESGLGEGGVKATSSAEVIFEYYDSGANVVRIDRGGVGAMSSPRGNHSGVLLKNGTVLTVGGVTAPPAMIKDGEFFNPL